MQYKVTPMMKPPEEAKGAKKPREPGQPKKKRRSAVYDADGNEVLISLMCAKCRSLKPLAQFGLRKMADGAIRNQPWCRTCRGATSAKKAKVEEAVAIPAVAQPSPVFGDSASTSELPRAADPDLEITAPGILPKAV